MNGDKEIEMKRRQHIDNKIEEQRIIRPYLLGFKNYIDKSTTSTTVYNYINYVVSFMEYSHNKMIKYLNVDDYSGYLSSISDKTSSYQIAVYSALKKFSTYLYITKQNPQNPMQYIERPKFKESIETIKKREKGYLTKKEITILINSIKEGVGTLKARKFQETWKERDLFMNKVRTPVSLDVG